MIVVADASPLIALARVGRLVLLRDMFESLLLPEAVWREVAEAGLDKAGTGTILQADWIKRRPVSDTGLVSLLRRDLGAGEAEAIVLARETDACLLLMDEQMGRAAAKRLGLRVSGLVGVLIEARERGLLVDSEAVVNELHEKSRVLALTGVAAIGDFRWRTTLNHCLRRRKFTTENTELGPLFFRVFHLLRLLQNDGHRIGQRRTGC